jgi:hypothetical protein
MAASTPRPMKVPPTAKRLNRSVLFALESLPAMLLAAAT